MRWLYCLVWFGLLAIVAKAQQPSFLQKEIQLPEQNCSLQDVFDRLEYHNIITAYNSQNIKPDTKIEFPFSKSNILQLLEFLEKNYAITYSLKSDKIIFTRVTRNHTISGFVKEFGSSETLAGANISISPNYGTFSNAYGFYSLTLPEGDYELNVSYIGYVSKKKHISISQDLQLDISMKSASQQLAEIVVKPQKSLTEKSEFHQINLKKLNTTPVFLGADDAIKRLQIIPGTGGGITGFSELSVRGGDVHENLVLLDGVPVYNYNHFPGILSIFNPAALKTINFYKGLFPARYAGRLSSVTDIKMREGNMETYHMGGSIDLATLSLFVEGPILKSKASFIISGRRSWIDALTHIGNSDEGFDFHLQDINLKTNYSPSSKDQIYLSLYRGVDNLCDSKEEKNKETNSLSWSNQIAVMKWNHIFSNKMFCNTLLAFSNFDNIVESVTKSSQISEKIKNEYSLKEFNLSTNIDYFSKFYQLKFGASIQKNIFEIPLVTNAQNSEKIATLQWRAYIENKVKFNSNVHGNIGLNYVLYQHAGKNKHFFQPRINLNYQISSNSFFSLGFSEMYQFIHQLGNNSVNLPYAFRLPASQTFLPSISRLYEAKYTLKLRKEKDTFSASTYFKKQKNILRYKPGQDLFNKQLANDWENQVLIGQRKILGLEVAYYADFSPLLLNFSYVFSKNKEQFPNINNNQFYPNALTPKHIFILTSEYSFNKKHSISAVGGYNTGRYISIPTYRIGDIDDVVNNTNSNNSSYIEGSTNGFQLRNNYHIDLGYTFKTDENKHGKHIIKLGIYSLLGSPAPFRASATVFENKVSVEEVALPSPMPYVNYTFKF